MVSHGHHATVVTHEGGVKFAANVRGHRILVDQPRWSGGDDAGPSPIELLGASIGTCVALYVQQFCHTRELPYEGMSVEVEQLGATNPNRVAEFTVRVNLPAGLPEQYRPMLERVARSCPAHNTLHMGAEVKILIDAGHPVGAA